MRAHKTYLCVLQKFKNSTVFKLLNQLNYGQLCMLFHYVKHLNKLKIFLKYKHIINIRHKNTGIYD